MGNFDASRFKAAREETGLTQEAFGRALGLSAEFISLLESGKRTPSLQTLSRIAAFLKRDMGDFLPARETTFAVLFRAAGPAALIRNELDAFQRYAEDYLRLEDLTGRRLDPAPIYASESAAISPARMAAEERRRLGLGDEPVRDIFALIERNGLRILRRPLPAAAEVSGVFIHLDDRRASFALINSAQSLCRQIFTAAHEYCHYLKDRHSAPVIDGLEIFEIRASKPRPASAGANAGSASESRNSAASLPASAPVPAVPSASAPTSAANADSASHDAAAESTPASPAAAAESAPTSPSAAASASLTAAASAVPKSAPPSATPRNTNGLTPDREQFAQEFAAHFLMPPTKVRDFVERELGVGSGGSGGGSGGGRRLSFDDVLLVKRYFGVSAQAMLRTLRELGLLSSAEEASYLERDPVARERAVFGASIEDCPQPAPSSAPQPDAAGVIVSDRYRLLKAEAISRK